jgi:hypothetical protein
MRKKPQRKSGTDVDIKSNAVTGGGTCESGRETNAKLRKSVVDWSEGTQTFTGES